MTRPVRRPRRLRRGFTLVEVLLSAGLMLLVIAASYAAIDLFRRVTYAGRAESERSQIVRAIERRMISDLRAVVFQPAKPVATTTTSQSSAGGGTATLTPGVGAADDTSTGSTGSASSGVGTGGIGGTGSSGTDPSGSGTGTTADTGTTTTATTTPAAAFTGASVGLFGDATTLVMHVSRPDRVIAGAVPSDPAFATGDVAAMIPLPGDLRSVSYFLATAGGGGLSGMVGNVASGGSAGYSMEAGAQGLARLDGDRRAVVQADAAGDTAALAAQAAVLAAEVVEVRFRYFDGAAWYDVWDSAAANRLPRAVEVTLLIEVDPEGRLQSHDPLSSQSAHVETHRFVVAMPSADAAAAATTAGTASTTSTTSGTGF